MATPVDISERCDSFHVSNLADAFDRISDHPSCWVVDSVKEAEGDENDESSEDENDGQGKSEKPTLSITYGTSSAYREFLSFLGSGCAGSPIQGYPAVLVILSTIPKNVRPESTGSTSAQHIIRCF